MVVRFSPGQDWWHPSPCRSIGRVENRRSLRLLAVRPLLSYLSASLGSPPVLYQQVHRLVLNSVPVPDLVLDLGSFRKDRSLKGRFRFPLALCHNHNHKDSYRPLGDLYQLGFLLLDLLLVALDPGQLLLSQTAHSSLVLLLVSKISPRSLYVLGRPHSLLPS
ncbi:hypothetical protein SISSUDRAFT_690289 [Sistotremastrum suecicum HHB10207 ss-3]|uniref:Uncharacterized protein n=1 Tax=Sistotremastrum suecicum HHB10207 ss-3 TaxID=1314776 RepID=A0A166I3Y8_9AGAM|nr:hypothetical protein SISSUDRAFT_690289 [Sistotremastrum suecicum HHB10207 ss-3]